MPAHFGFDRRDIEQYTYYPNGFSTTTYGPRGGVKTVNHKPELLTAEQAAKVREEHSKSENPQRYLHLYKERNNQNLQEVDELICDFMAKPKPSKDFDSEYYYICHEYGWWSLYNLGGHEVEQKHIDHIYERALPLLQKAGKSEGELARFKHLLQWVFLEKWIFWGTG